MSSNTQKVCLDCGAALPLESAASSCTRCLLEACFENGSAFGAPEAAEPPRTSLAVPGEVFGDYELVAEIARGGMGVVYKARQRSLDRVVAVKMLLPGRLTSREMVRRFRVEAEAASRLRHPGIVSIHDVGECEGQHFYSMDFIEGQDLVRRVAGGRVPFELAARWVEAIARAIHHAHQRGILHRDLKPANVLIDPQDEPHVTDFGLAKLLDGGLDLTVTGHLIGTPSFMPPEQADPESGQVTVVSDVYGLGAILYFLLTGHAPFQGNSLEHTLKLLLTEAPVPPSRHRLTVPRDLETICLKCLAKEPQRRYSSAADLADDLRAWLRREPIRARPVALAERLWFWARRNPALAALSFALAIAVVAGAWIQQRRLEENRQSLQETLRGRNVSEGLVQYLIQDLTAQLRPVGRLRLLENVNRTVRRYYQGLPMQQSPPNPTAGKAQFLCNDASVLRELGRYADAQKSARAAIELIEPLTRSEPQNPQWPAILAIANSEMVEIRLAQDRPSAIPFARESVAWHERVCTLDPTNEMALTRLANARLQFASTLLVERQGAEEAAHQVDQAVEFLEGRQGNGKLTRDREQQLARSTYYRGLIETARGNKEAARLKFTEYLQQAEKLAKESEDAGDAQAEAELVMAHSYLGEAYYGMEDFEEAATHFREYHRLSEHLWNRDPGNANFTREFEFSLEWLATILDKTGRPAEEITPLLQRACEVAQQLARQFPQGDVGQENSARALTRYADWLINHGNVQEGRRLLAQEIEHRWNLLLQFGDRPAHHTNLVTAIDWSEYKGGPPNESKANQVERFRYWLRRVQSEAAKPGANREWHRTEAILHQKVAAHLAGREQWRETADELQLAAAVWQKLASENPRDPDATTGTARALCGITIATLHCATPADAVAHLRKLVGYARLHAEVLKHSPQFLEGLGTLQGQLLPFQDDWTAQEQAIVRDFDQLADQLREPPDAGSRAP